MKLRDASRLGMVGVAGAICTLALVQPVAADPIYRLEAGPGYSSGSGIASFIVPSVAQGLLVHGDSDDLPTELTLTGLYHSDDKVRCTAVTRLIYACSTEAASQADDGDGNGWQSNSRGSGRNGSLDGSSGNGLNGADTVTTDFVNSLGTDPSSLLQVANLTNDPVVNLTNDVLAGPANIPEPSSLMLVAGALLAFGIAARGLRRGFAPERRACSMPS